MMRAEAGKGEESGHFKPVFGHFKPEGLKH